MIFKNNLFRLTGKIQHYQWGGYHFIPELLHVANPDHRPFAEYWLGAHDNAPAEIDPDGQGQAPLNEYIRRHPEALGKQVYGAFGRLPYLLKVLDVRDMLSIQVHPSKQAAVAEFERENKEGIPLNAPERNYKDDNHKPELMVALSDFWLLHGFKPVEQIRETILSIEEFDFMLPLFGEGDYKKLYNTLMEMDQQEVNRILEPLLVRMGAAYECGYLSKESPHFWAARAAATFNEPGKIDRGIFSVYLLNLVNLKKGEAIFQDAGILHAYLEGQNMEIMANSDNVLRGGLTPKHVDVKELMKHVSFEAVIPRVIHGSLREQREEVFLSPAPDFQLSRFVLAKNETSSLYSPTVEIFIVMEGAVELKEEGAVELKEEKKKGLLLKSGEAAVSFAGAALKLSAAGTGVVYRASCARGN